MMKHMMQTITGKTFFMAECLFLISGFIIAKNYTEAMAVLWCLEKVVGGSNNCGE
jgi:hypothetical protein